jgi:hypothetical protein
MWLKACRSSVLTHLDLLPYDYTKQCRPVKGALTKHDVFLNGYKCGLAQVSVSDVFVAKFDGVLACTTGCRPSTYRISAIDEGRDRYEAQT